MSLGPAPIVCFLRGMNLGGRRITNDDLTAVFVDAGHADVSAYQASGNIILGAAGSGPDTSETALAQMLEAALGYAVPVFVRTGASLAALAADSPISGRRGADDGKPQIIFLGSAADPSAVDLDPLRSVDGDEVHLIGRELHWLPVGGLADRADVQQALDRQVGPTTMRTLGTIERLVKRINP